MIRHTSRGNTDLKNGPSHAVSSSLTILLSFISM
jgi:hypothetical protein